MRARERLSERRAFFLPSLFFLHNSISSSYTLFFLYVLSLSRHNIKEGKEEMGKKAAAKAKKQKKSTSAPSASFPGAAGASNKVRIVVDARFFFSLSLSFCKICFFVGRRRIFCALHRRRERARVRAASDENETLTRRMCTAIFTG